MSERVSSLFQPVAMEFLRRVQSVTLREKVRSCVIRKPLKVEEAYFFQTERSLHLPRMSRWDRRGISCCGDSCVAASPPWCLYRITWIAATTARDSWRLYFTASVERAFLMLSLLCVLDTALSFECWMDRNVAACYYVYLMLLLVSAVSSHSFVLIKA